MSRYSRELLMKIKVLGKEDYKEDQEDLVSFRIGMMKMMMLKDLIGN